MPSSEFLLGKSQSAFDQSGSLISAEKVAELEEIFREFVLFTEITTELLSKRTLKQKTKKFSWQE
jgi:hypothetical protein